MLPHSTSRWLWLLWFENCFSILSCLETDVKVRQLCQFIFSTLIVLWLIWGLCYTCCKCHRFYISMAEVLVVSDIFLEINTLIFTLTLNCKAGIFSDEKRYFISLFILLFYLIMNLEFCWCSLCKNKGLCQWTTYNSVSLLCLQIHPPFSSYFKKEKNSIEGEGIIFH